MVTYEYISGSEHTKKHIVEIHNTYGYLLAAQSVDFFCILGDIRTVDSIPDLPTPGFINAGH
jgi:hypothetical protein